MLAQSLKNRSVVASVTAEPGTQEVIRLGVDKRGENLFVQAFKGTSLIGESSPYPVTDEASPAADLAGAFAVLLEMTLKICVGTPKAHWKGEAYTAPRPGQSNEYDAGEWYAELFGGNEDAAVALSEVAEIGFWSPDKSAECLRFEPDVTRSAAELPLADRIAAIEARTALRAESRTSSRRMRY